MFTDSEPLVMNVNVNPRASHGIHLDYAGRQSFHIFCNPGDEDGHHHELDEKTYNLVLTMA